MNREPLNFTVAPMFASVVAGWLDQTALKTRQWADQVSLDPSFHIYSMLIM